MFSVSTRTRAVLFTGLALFFAGAPHFAWSQGRWRKEKPLAPAAKITVNVEKALNGKPISNAAVIFRAFKEGRQQGSMEVKTDPDGNASIDIIEIGSHVKVQVIADGYATAAQEFDVQSDEKSVSFKMLKPRAQVSAYEDNDGKASERPSGVQEPKYLPPSKKKPATAPAAQPKADAGTAATPKSSTPQ